MGAWLATCLSSVGWASVLMAVAGLLAWAGLRFFRAKSPGLHQAAWWIVLLQGLILFQATLTIPWYEPEAVPAQVETVPVSAIPPSVELARFDSAVQPAVEAAVPEKEPTAVAESLERRAVLPWPWLLAIAWIGGMALILVRWLWGYVVFLRACCDMRDGGEEWRVADGLSPTLALPLASLGREEVPAPPASLGSEVLAEWKAVLREAGVGASIPIQFGFDAGPALCRHPLGYRLIVPIRLWRRLTGRQRRCILQHEVAHYLRGDVWRLFLARLLALPHWFNPMAWHAVRSIELATEYACDDYVRRMDPARKIDLARTLLAVGEMLSQTPAWATAGGGGCLFKRISRILSANQEGDSIMKKAMIVVVFVLAVLVSLVRVELVAQESPPNAQVAKPAADTDSPKTTAVQKRIRELSEQEAIPHEEIEAVAAQAAAAGNAGRVFAEVVAAYHDLGATERIVAWAQAALRQPISPLERLRMFQYWAEAAHLQLQGQPPQNEPEEPPTFCPGGAPAVFRPAFLGLMEASRYRIPVDGFGPSQQPQGDAASWTQEQKAELVGIRDKLVHLLSKGSPAFELALKRFFLSEGFIESLPGPNATPRWLGEGRAWAGTFLLDYPALWKDLPPVADAYIGEVGAFDDVKLGLKEDSHGPQVDLDVELIPFLGKHTTVVTDYRQSPNGSDEEFLLAVEVTNARQVADVVRRLMEKEPDAKILSEGEEKIWAVEQPEDGSGPQGVCVTHGYYLAGDLDLLLETLKRAP